MSAILLTAPAVEPVSLDEARAFLRVEHNDDDEVIAEVAAASADLKQHVSDTVNTAVAALPQQPPT